MATTRFLFWNLNRNQLEKAIGWLDEDHQIDVVLLAESPFSSLPGFHLIPGERPAVQIYTRIPTPLAIPRFDSKRFSILRLALPGRPEILLGAVHLSSKLYMTKDSQILECSELYRTIVEEEDKAGHQRTVLVGDFNMNPFEGGVVGAAGLHAVMSREVASKGSRTVQGREYRFFYNPMWGHMNDAKQTSAGSFYHAGAEHVNYFWNTFDQVLIRPELMGKFQHENLRIVTKAGSRSLVRSDGKPDGTNFSDHLPIVFELEF